MKDNIRLVMEETGCDEGQAIVALESCDYNISKAISKIFDLLRDIVVLKGKFRTFENHLYGMLTIAVDIKHNRLLRTKVLVTYNPKVYETDLSQNWYEYEKKLYTARLISGSIPDTTLNLENTIVNKVTGEYKDSFFSAIKENNIMETVDILEDILTGVIKTQSINFEISSEHLNLSQFKKISDQDFRQQMEFNFIHFNLGNSEPLLIDVLPLSDGNPSIKAGSLLPGDEIFVFINDQRDIARYLSGLLGGRNASGNVALPAKVQSVVRDNSGANIVVRLAIGVIGRTVMPEKIPIKVLSLVRRKGIVNYLIFNFYLILSRIMEKIRREQIIS